MFLGCDTMIFIDSEAMMFLISVACDLNFFCDHDDEYILYCISFRDTETGVTISSAAVREISATNRFLFERGLSFTRTH